MKNNIFSIDTPGKNEEEFTSTLINMLGDEIPINNIKIEGKETPGEESKIMNEIILNDIKNHENQAQNLPNQNNKPFEQRKQHPIISPNQEPNNSIQDQISPIQGNNQMNLRESKFRNDNSRGIINPQNIDNINIDSGQAINQNNMNSNFPKYQDQNMNDVVNNRKFSKDQSYGRANQPPVAQRIEDNNQEIKLRGPKNNSNKSSNNNINQIIPQSQPIQHKMIGLVNFNNNCYMNSCLQCLVNLPSFKRQFFNNKNQENYQKNLSIYPLCFAFSRLMLHLFPKQRENSINSYKPTSIHKLICFLNHSFKGNSIKDAIDLFIFILNRLHNELNIKEGDRTNFNNIDMSNNDLVLKNYIQNLMSTNDSFIFNTFSWVSKKVRTCSSCKKNFYFYQDFFTFDLEISKFNEFWANKKIGNKPKKLIDCISYYEKNKTMFNIFCPFCKEKNTFCQNTKIFTSPHYFIFTLTDNKIEKTIIKYDYQIDLSKFIEKKESPLKYTLYSVVALYNEKYVAFSKTHVNENIYYFNDENTQIISIDNLLNNNDLIPIILIYRKISEQ